MEQRGPSHDTSQRHVPCWHTPLSEQSIALLQLVLDASTNATTKAKDSGSVPKPPPERGILSVLRDVVEHEGIGGLYRGCSAQIFTAITKTGILLTTKEKIAAFAMAIVLLFDRKRRKKLQ